MAAGKVTRATIADSGEKPRPPAKASRGHSTQTMHRIAVVKPSSPKLALRYGLSRSFLSFFGPGPRPDPPAQALAAGTKSRNTREAAALMIGFAPAVDLLRFR